MQALEQIERVVGVAQNITRGYCPRGPSTSALIGNLENIFKLSLVTQFRSAIAFDLGQESIDILASCSIFQQFPQANGLVREERHVLGTN